VAANSVVLRSLPPDSYSSGNPARVASTLEEWVAQRRLEGERLPRYTRSEFNRLRNTAAGRATLLSELASGGYLVD
jgi:hypothetical protein